MTLFSSSPFVIDFHCIGASESESLHNTPFGQWTKVEPIFTFSYQMSQLIYTYILCFFPLLRRTRTLNTLLMHSFVVLVTTLICTWLTFFFHSYFSSTFQVKMLIFAAKFSSLAPFAQIFTRSRIVDNTLLWFDCCSVVISVSCFSAPFRL